MNKINKLGLAALLGVSTFISGCASHLSVDGHFKHPYNSTRQERVAAQEHTEARRFLNSGAEYTLEDGVVAFDLADFNKYSEHLDIAGFYEGTFFGDGVRMVLPDGKVIDQVIPTANTLSTPWGTVDINYAGIPEINERVREIARRNGVENADRIVVAQYDNDEDDVVAPFYGTTYYWDPNTGATTCDAAFIPGILFDNNLADKSAYVKVVAPVNGVKDTQNNPFAEENISQVAMYMSVDECLKNPARYAVLTGDLWSLKFTPEPRPLDDLVDTAAYVVTLGGSLGDASRAYRDVRSELELNKDSGQYLPGHYPKP